MYKSNEKCRETCNQGAGPRGRSTVRGGGHSWENTDSNFSKEK